MKKVVVIGATGMLGQPVTKELIRAGFEVTLAVRNETKARKLFPYARLLQADVFNVESLIMAFKEQDIVYLNLHTPPGSKPSDRLTEKEGIDNIIAAAKATNIQRIAMLSSVVMRFNGMNGFRWWLFSIKQLAVDRVMQSGIPYTIFYASNFMESLDQLMLKGNAILLAGKSKVPMWFIAGEDYARQVARSFQTITTGNREYVVQGTEAFTMEKAAAVFRDHYTIKKIRIVRAPLPVLELLSNFNRIVKYGYQISTALNNYPEKFEAGQTWQELGKPTVTVQTYAAARSNKLLNAPPGK